MTGISKVRKEIGANVRSFRMHAGVSQKKLGEKAGLHPVYISHVERVTKAVSVEAAVETIAGVAGADGRRGCGACEGKCLGAEDSSCAGAMDKARGSRNPREIDRIMTGQNHAEQKQKNCWPNHKRRGGINSVLP